MSAVRSRQETLVRARRHMLAGEWEEALDLWQAILDEDGSHCGARAGSAEALYQLGRLDESARAWRMVQKQEPEVARSHSGLARIAARHGDGEEAERLFRHALGLEPDHFGAKVGLLDLLLARNDLEQAESLAGELATREPTRFQGPIALAHIALRRGRWEEAHDRYREVERAFPDRLEARRAQADALVELGRFEEARAVYERLMAEPDLEHEGRLGLGRVAMARCSWQDAKEQLDQALRLDPESLQALLGRGDALAGQGRYEEARIACEETIRLHPHHPQAPVRRQQLCERRGCWRETLAGWEAILGRFPDQVVAGVHVARALVELGRLDAARDRLEALRERAPGHPGVVDTLVFLREREGDVQGALVEARALVSDAPVSLSACIRAALLVDRVAGSPAALEHWRAAVERFPTHPAPAAALVGCLLEAGDVRGAAEEVERALCRFEGSPAVWGQAIWTALHQDATPDRGLRLLEEAQSKCGDHMSLRLLALRLHTLAHRTYPASFRADCAAIEVRGDHHEAVGLAALLSVIGGLEGASALLDRLDLRLDGVEARAALSYLRARLDFFAGGWERGLHRLQQIPDTYRDAHGIRFPKAPYSGAKAAAAPSSGRRAAVLCHVFHLDLLDELVEHLQHVKAVPADYWFSLSEALPEPARARERLESLFAGARFVVAPNVGFDVGGYFRILEEIEDERYDLAFVLHTKKGAHALETGARWREHLLGAIAGSPEIVRENVDIMRRDPKVQLVGSLTPVSLMWGVRHRFPKYVEVLRRATGKAYAEDGQLYVPGTMFVCRMDYLRRIREKSGPVELEAYESLPFASRFGGTYGHAMEILFGSQVMYEGGTATYLTDPGRLLLSRR